MINLNDLSKLAIKYNYPLPECFNGVYRVSARGIYSALKICIPFTIWFSYVRHKLTCENGDDYTPIKNNVKGKIVKDYMVSLTVAGDMGLMYKPSRGEHLAKFYITYKQVIQWENITQLENRIKALENKLGIIK